MLSIPVITGRQSLQSRVKIRQSSNLRGANTLTNFFKPGRPVSKQTRHHISIENLLSSKRVFPDPSESILVQSLELKSPTTDKPRVRRMRPSTSEADTFMQIKIKLPQKSLRQNAIQTVIFKPDRVLRRPPKPSDKKSTQELADLISNRSQIQSDAGKLEESPPAKQAATPR